MLLDQLISWISVMRHSLVFMIDDWSNFKGGPFQRCIGSGWIFFCFPRLVSLWISSHL